MTKKVNTSGIGRQQGNQGKRIPKERRRAKINGSIMGFGGCNPLLSTISVFATHPCPHFPFYSAACLQKC